MSKKPIDRPRIHQAIPIQDWVAVFEGKDSSSDVRPVVCLALLRDTPGIYAMVVEDGKIVPAESIDGYTDLAPEADVLEELFGDELDPEDAPS